MDFQDIRGLFRPGGEVHFLQVLTRNRQDAIERIETQTHPLKESLDSFAAQ